MLAIDHVIWVTHDLDAAGERLASEHGLASADGGIHPGIGTANRIVPLGDAYLELMTVHDRPLAAANPLGRRVLEVLDDGEGFLGWVVRIEDIRRVTERRPVTALPGSRARPDGSSVSWVTAGMDVMMGDPSMPFFIQWDDMAAHPGRSGVAGGALSWIDVAPGNDARLRAWLFNEPLPVRFVDGEPGVQAIGIETARGELVLR